MKALLVIRNKTTLDVKEVDMFNGPNGEDYYEYLGTPVGQEVISVGGLNLVITHNDSSDEVPTFMATEHHERFKGTKHRMIYGDLLIQSFKPIEGGIEDVSMSESDIKCIMDHIGYFTRTACFGEKSDLTYRQYIKFFDGPVDYSRKEDGGDVSEY